MPPVLFVKIIRRIASYSILLISKSNTGNCVYLLSYGRLSGIFIEKVRQKTLFSFLAPFFNFIDVRSLRRVKKMALIFEYLFFVKMSLQFESISCVKMSLKFESLYCVKMSLKFESLSCVKMSLKFESLSCSKNSNHVSTQFIF
jgi:hypothetical protein